MQLIFKIENYEGPMDLILDLFKSHKLEIDKINIYTIINDYLQIVNQLSEKNKTYDEIISYLDLAAELVLYKSKIISHNEEEEELDENNMDIDDFIDRILEYKKYKEASKDIQQLNNQRNFFLTKEQNNLSDYSNNEIEKIDYKYFYKIVNKVFLEIEQNKDETLDLEINKQLNIEDCVEDLKYKEVINFNQEIKNQNKQKRIVLFLAILELLRNYKYNFEYVNNTLLIKKINKGES